MLAMALSLGGTAIAQEAASQPNDDGVPGADEIGRAEFLRGRRAYDSGDYETALDAFQRALELTSRPTLYYNVGLALDRLRRDADALAAYERYLELVEESNERPTVEARVLALRRALEEDNERSAAAVAAAEAERERALQEERERLMGANQAKRRRTGLIVGISSAVVVGAVVAVVIIATRGGNNLEQGDFGPASRALVSW